MAKSKIENVLVLGASANSDRYSYKAVKMLNRYHHQVYAIGAREGLIDDIKIEKEWIYSVDIDTVTLYLSPQNQVTYYDFIMQLNPKRVIFNPGTENYNFIQMLENKGIDTVQDCTLVLLSAGDF